MPVFSSVYVCHSVDLLQAEETAAVAEEGAALVVAVVEEVAAAVEAEEDGTAVAGKYVAGRSHEDCLVTVL